MGHTRYVEYTEDDHEEYLNDMHETVEVCGMIMNQGTVLLNCDYIAFCESLNNREMDEWECLECNTMHTTEDEAEECCNVCEDCGEVTEHHYKVCDDCDNKQS